MVCINKMMMMMFILHVYRRETKARRGDGDCGRLDEEAGKHESWALVATPCPKSLHGKGEKWIARNILQGLDSRQPMTAMTEKKSPG